MKKILGFMLNMCLMLTLFAVVPAAASELTEGDYTYIVENGEATITDFNYQVKGAVTTPKTLGGYPVTRIGEGAFSGCSKITSLVISEGVKYIDKEAVWSCRAMTSVSIPKGVLTIGESAFEYCGLTGELVIPEGVTSIGETAFHNMQHIEEVTIPDSVKTIGRSAFAACFALTTVNMGSGVTFVGQRAFWDSDSITAVNIKDLGAWSSIDFTDGLGNPLRISNKLYLNGELVTDLIIPEGTTQIGSCVFYGYKIAKTVSIPGSVKRIGYDAFYYCPGITGLYIAEGVTRIEQDAFSDCHGIKSINIPDSVTYLAPEAFFRCKGATSLTIGSGLTSIENNTFEHCYDIRTVRISKNITNVGHYAFYKCNDLSRVYFEGTNEQWNAITFGYLNERILNANLYCNSEEVNVKSVDLGIEALTLFIGDSMMLTPTVYPQNSTNRNVLWTSSDNSIATVVDGVVTARAPGNAVITVITEDGGFKSSCVVSGDVPDGYMMAGFCGEDAEWALSVDGVQTIWGSGAMDDYEVSTSPWYEHRESIKKIVVEGVDNVGQYAFNYCSNLEAVEIGESVKTVGRNAFAYCPELEAVKLPSTLTTVGKAAFYNCSALSAVRYNGTKEEFANVTVEGSNAPFTAATMRYSDDVETPVPQVVGLRTESVSYNAGTNTITAFASDTNATAGVAIVVEGVEELSAYTTVSGNGFTVANSGGYRYFVAKYANGAEQSTEIYAKVDGVKHTYKLNITFVDKSKPKLPIADIATLRCYGATWSDTSKTISVNVDRFPVINASGSMGVAVIPSEGYTVSYVFTGSNGTTSGFSSTSTSKYTLASSGVNTESSGGGALGNVPMKIFVKNDSTRIYANVILSDGTETVTYKMTIALRDRAAEGDVDISGVLPLRADGESFVIDNEAKTITYETVEGARSAGFAVKVDNGLNKSTRPRRLLTAVSGYQLAHGEINDSNKDEYDRYVVARRSAGVSQTYEIKVHGGDDGLSYSKYTVTVTFK